MRAGTLDHSSTWPVDPAGIEPAPLDLFRILDSNYLNIPIYFPEIFDSVFSLYSVQRTHQLYERSNYICSRFSGVGTDIDPICGIFICRISLTFADLTNGNVLSLNITKRPACQVSSHHFLTNPDDLGRQSYYEAYDHVLPPGLEPGLCLVRVFIL